MGRSGGGRSLYAIAQAAGHVPDKTPPWHADDLALLEASCQLAPAADNPYSEHPLPLQAAQQMEACGRLGGAALAYEAAARVLPSLLIMAEALFLP